MKRDDYYFINRDLYSTRYGGRNIDLKKINNNEYHYKEYVIKKFNFQTLHHRGSKWKIYKNNKEIISCYNLNNVKEYFKSIRK